MEHKQFQVNNPQGGIDVQFNIDFDGQKPNITNINIHGSYETGLPPHPTIEYRDGKNVLVARYERFVEGKIRNIIEIINTELSNHIVREIYRIVDEATHRFTP